MATTKKIPAVAARKVNTPKPTPAKKPNTPRSAPSSQPKPVGRPLGSNAPPQPTAGAARRVAAKRASSALGEDDEEDDDMRRRGKTQKTGPGKPGPKTGGTVTKTEAKAWAVPGKAERRFNRDDLCLLEDGSFADAKIVCMKREWNVHKTMLVPRSKFFAKAFSPDNAQCANGTVALHDYDPEEIDDLLRFIYSGSLDMEKFSLDKGSFQVYAKLFNLGENFLLATLADDALSMLGQFCDQKLAQICSFDLSKSGTEGVVKEDVGISKEYMDDLTKAIHIAYEGIGISTRLQRLLAAFVWAGRERLSIADAFATVTEKCPMFGNDMFKLMLGQTTCEWLPKIESGQHVSSLNKAATALDHTKRTQHPDRCYECMGTFDMKISPPRIRAVYHPFEAKVRPLAWCNHCVDKYKEAPMWRLDSEELHEK
ncbi:hypothetical protein B0T17DRAFT_121324 [Bombardia bombarda]|uniref:BTB domain-containing protein n=1 Tax=Bombardia bombarda TaxID=252184 RepID=A0AA39TH10_9PEZI|nr:hypothetical protein B0T17DRAFT_121324 [Bombardia bombarda]